MYFEVRVVVCADPGLFMSRWARVLLKVVEEIRAVYLEQFIRQQLRY